MPITKNVYQEGTKIKSMCRVCLTQSNHIMFRLADPLKTEENIEAKTYLEALEKTVCARVELNGKFPESICPMCVSFLKMALQFITQFKESQSKIQAMFKTSSPVYYNTIKPREQCDVETVAKVQIESKLNEVSPVELIVKDQAYSLNQLVVVENVDQSEHDYKGFINNLGKEISATLVNSTQKTKSKNNITIIKENSDEEIDNIDSDDYQEELESIKIEYDDAECDFKREIDDNTEMDEDNNDEIIEYIVEDDQNTEDLESNEQSDNAEEQENVDKTEEYDSESRSEHSENENYEYIEIDMLDKDAIESLIIDRAKVNAKDTQQFQQQRNRRKKSVTDSPKDEFEREVKFPCGVCKKIFSSARTLKNHVRRTHMAKYEKVFTCEVCGAVCETRSKFVNHKLQHVEKQFKCELCDKMYSTKAHLKVHMNVHANKRPFLCNVCGKDFNYANALTYHMRLHTGEKNYHCEYCPKRFRMINSLNRHLRTHTGEKPYKCQYCGRNFSSKGEVVCHEYIHTGYRPYHCKYCKKGFSKTHNLKIHLLSHGGPYNCKICKKTFIEPNILSMHHRIAHKDLAAELNNEENENSDSEDNSPKVEYEEDSTVEYVDAEEVEMNEAEFIYTDDS